MNRSHYKVDYFLNEQAKSLPSIGSSIAGILNDFEKAPGFHMKMEDYNASPLVQLPTLANELGVRNILLKNEAKRFGVPAIKMLGASFAIHRILQADAEIKELCTATDGNHGRAVAWAARKASISARVFVPKYTVESRIKAIRNEGAQVIIIDDDYDEAVRQASEYAEKTGAKLVQDTAWENYLEMPALITAGYYTQLYEIESQTNNFFDVPDIILVQSGVGSWPSAVTHWVRNKPKLKESKIICVEPYNSDCFLESAKQGKRSTTKKSQHTIMAGLNCGTPSILAWEIMRKGVDLFLSIDDNFALEAMKKLYTAKDNSDGIMAGESGAAGFAGLLALLKSPSLKSLREKLNISLETRALIFNTEGITDPDFFAEHIL